MSVRGEGHNERGDPSKYQGLAPHYPMTIMMYNDSHYDDNEIITLKRSAGVCKRRGETQGGVRARPPIIPWQLFCFHRSSDPPPPLSPILRPTALGPIPTPPISPFFSPTAPFHSILHLADRKSRISCHNCTERRGRLIFTPSLMLRFYISI